ncbi:hypothetical protein A3A76_00565 [Candidatus Woesebacteria bacterium RIFCSPLOWO2_01_FULL_39_23]|nr:MAG: hypothetical protein A2141_05820 [Candidatus Woesebacteria bacterium RBG_16_40_11]OGM36925.1 MAG: hypothetical protein A3E41_05130 [Candidatus Woesebacteria bacterium RIFCSPHIGHO2_12_FULL_38_9]OGM63355.1 MAG: hypothetical protein A3A76_00565 [Candidatus Woesebacteria bacterium RIFCSPLOWO2_01_FULL_39_23]
MVEQEAEYTVLYDYVLNRLVTCGITKEEFNSLKKHPIGHRSVEGFINANIKIGNFEWLNGKLVNVDRKVRLDLTKKEDEKIHLLAHKFGLTELDFVSKIVRTVLKRI